MCGRAVVLIQSSDFRKQYLACCELITRSIWEKVAKKLATKPRRICCLGLVVAKNQLNGFYFGIELGASGEEGFRRSSNPIPLGHRVILGEVVVGKGCEKSTYRPRLSAHGTLPRQVKTPLHSSRQSGKTIYDIGT